LSGPRKGWDLTQEAFDELLAWLNPDRERAARKYEDIRDRLIRIFMHRGCATAEDLADKTINQVARKVCEIKTYYEGDPALYFYGAARNINSEYFRSSPDSVDLTPEMLAAPPAVEPDESEREHECLEACLGSMGQPDQELLLEYYREDGGAKIEHHKEMALRRGVTLNALRILVCRLRARFKKCMRECLREAAA
jgi:DNA-directed RNA polymerase specialized sigma24 family protein